MADLRTEFLALYPDGELLARFVVRPRDIAYLPDGSTMFYNAEIVECPRAPTAVGQVRDIFRLPGDGIQLNAAKGVG